MWIPGIKVKQCVLLNTLPKHGDIVIRLKVNKLYMIILSLNSLELGQSF